MAEQAKIIEPATKWREYLISGIAFTVTLALCVLILIFWDDIKNASKFGYAGVFVISLIEGATIIVPLPGFLFTFTMGSLLHPAIVGALAGFGEALGSIVVYFIGYGEHRILTKKNPRLALKFKDWINHHGALAIFAMSAIINPVYYLFVMVIATFHYGVFKFFLLSWAGKTVKGMAFAYCGYFGLNFLLNWLGVG
jgi:membrane protein YqaA with SNARE-associated domain